MLANTLPDLEITCGTCHGTGQVSEIITSMLKIKGKRVTKETEIVNICDDCEGFGKVLTQTGNQILEFINRRRVDDLDYRICDLEEGITNLELDNPRVG